MQRGRRAVRRSGHARRGLGQRRQARLHHGIGGQRCERDAGADLQEVIHHAQLGQLGDAAEIDHGVRADEATAHVGQQVGAAGDEATGGKLATQAHGVGGAGRTQQAEI
jgi:hypothetical protein